MVYDVGGWSQFNFARNALCGVDKVRNGWERDCDDWQSGADRFITWRTHPKSEK